MSVYTASFSRSIVGNAYLTLSLSRYASSTTQTQALALVTVPLDPLTSATASVVSTKSGDDVEHRAEALLQRSLPVGEGFGYYLRANTDRLLAGGVSYAGPYGRYSLEGSDAAGATALRASATGAVAWVGSDFVATQSIEQGYAVVRVADLEDVRVLQENQEVGRTRGGKLALTQIPALNSIKIAVDPVTVPMEVSLSRGHARSRAAAAHRRPDRLWRDAGWTAVVKLVLASGEPVPAGAIVTIDGRTESFPVGFDGETFLTRVTERQGITVRFNGLLCRIVVSPDAQIGALERRTPGLQDQACGWSQPVKRSLFTLAACACVHATGAYAAQCSVDAITMNFGAYVGSQVNVAQNIRITCSATAAARAGPVRSAAEPGPGQQLRAAPHAAQRRAGRHAALQPLPWLSTHRARHQRVGRRHRRDAGLARGHDAVERSADENGHRHHRGRRPRRHRSIERRVQRHGDGHHHLSLGRPGRARRGSPRRCAGARCAGHRDDRLSLRPAPRGSSARPRSRDQPGGP